MKVFDKVNVKIERIGDSVGVYLPLEYEAMEGFEAEFSAGVEGDEIVFSIKPHIQKAVEETVNELWRDLRILFSKIGDIGEKAPWGEMEIVWQTRKAFERKVPIAADEVITHRHSRAIYGKDEYVTGDREDIRRGIHDTITKLCELAALRLGFKSELFARAFGQAVGNNFSFTTCLIGTCEVLCEIFNEEFTKVDDDRLWSLTSNAAQSAVKAAYERIKYLERHPDVFRKEDERIRKKWGFQLNPA
jgi:hypothetical protein